MNQFGLSQALQLQQDLFPGAYFFCVMGLLVSVLTNWGNMQPILMKLIGILAIVIIANGYPTAIQSLANDFKELRDQIDQQNSWKNLFAATITEPTSSLQIAEKITFVCAQILQYLGNVAVVFLTWVQSFAFAGLIAVSPILLGFLATPWTQSIGINFLITTLGVCMWHLGIALVDLLLNNIAQVIVPAAILSGGIAGAFTGGVGALPIIVGALAGLLLISTAMYLAVPLVIASVLKGGSPLTTAAMAGMQMAGTGAGLGAMIGSQIAARMGGGSGEGGGDPLSKAIGDLTKAIGGMNGGGGGSSDSGPGTSGPRPGMTPAPGLGGAESSLIASDDAPRNVRSSTGYGGSPQTPAQRQAAILSSYSTEGTATASASTSASVTTNQLSERQAEAAQILEQRDKNYT